MNRIFVLCSVSAGLTWINIMKPMKHLWLNYTLFHKKKKRKTNFLMSAGCPFYQMWLGRFISWHLYLQKGFVVWSPECVTSLIQSENSWEFLGVLVQASVFPGIPITIVENQEMCKLQPFCPFLGFSQIFPGSSWEYWFWPLYFPGSQLQSLAHRSQKVCQFLGFPRFFMGTRDIQRPELELQWTPDWNR